MPAEIHFVLDNKMLEYSFCPEFKTRLDEVNSDHGPRTYIDPNPKTGYVQVQYYDRKTTRRFRQNIGNVPIELKLKKLHMNVANIVIVDNGAFTIKAGLQGVHDKQPKIITNAVVRSKGDKMTYFGHEIEGCRDFSSLHYRLPFEKGYLVDWDAQKAVWDGMFKKLLAINTAESSLLITEPYFNLPNLQDVYDQFAFEEYEFHSYYRCTPASLIPHGSLYSLPGLSAPECVLIVDSGFSFTHIIPILNGKIAWNAVKRIDVGGKLLTNQLKELVSFRQWNMMDETYIINDVKESCCYVSTRFEEDLETCRKNPKNNSIVREYILPDFSINRPGHTRTLDDTLDDTVQVLYMNNERFTVPEILFRPNDIGLEQSGLAATIAKSIALLPEDLQGMLWAHIGLIGGTTKTPGFRERLMAELRSLAPVDCEVNIFASDNPITEVYRSAVAFARKPEFSQHVVTRAEYQEMGSNACRRKFRDWKPAEKEAAKGKELTRGKAAARARDDNDDDSTASTKKSTKSKGKTIASVSRRRVGSNA